ncbi:MAG: phosphoribosylformylglycinamidine synthase, partial [Spirochaetaceae bacterium]|nr:phosphoribosylformylglycinamidine synthase [Spirochaetaceae bacterium]
SREELSILAPGLLYEPPTDNVISGIAALSGKGECIAREFLPGQFDQRADSAARGLRLSHPECEIDVRRADIIIIEGALSVADIGRIRNWLINPVDSRPKDLDRSSLEDKSSEPEAVPLLEGFCGLDAGGLEKLRLDRGLALALVDLEFIRSWFMANEKRDPTLAELKVLDTYWSDHCRHTTFETELASIRVAEGPESADIAEAMAGWEEARNSCGRNSTPRTLMDLATIAAREARQKGELEDWDVSGEINACTLKVDAMVNGRREPWLLSFKNETHNHPTEIEPYGGASTCLGGAVRDPLSGRAYVHQAVRVSGGADPRRNPADTRPGKLPQRLIAHGAAEGYAGYGNQLGLATAVVREHYHPGYEAKRLECGAVIGASPANHVLREAPEPGDVIILVGGRTGRDGIGGATGSSVAHDGTSLEKAGAEVQKGNPPEERKLQRLFRNPEASTLIRRCNDFGAGGVAVAVGELADGLDIDLDTIAVKYAGLDGLELALSESQERMAVVVNPGDAADFIRLAAEENLEAIVVAKITASRRLMMKWRGREIINLSRDLLDT